MKKIFVASVFLGLASMAQAAYIACTPSQPEIVTGGQLNPGSAVFTCSPAAGAGAGLTDDNQAGDGANVTGIRILLSGSQQQTNVSLVGVTFAVAFSSVENSPLFTLTPGCSISIVSNGAGNASGNCDSGIGVAFTAVAPVDVIPQFTVTVTGATNGGSLPNNASASLAYEVTAVVPDQPTPGVPEPSTYAMMAAGLIAVYKFRRS